ncbi:MAG TPA: CAP domain-containing protein, partial [Thermomicrobiales bacterium]|nr:CAP domain-containing protein [Thermomicrobiales bacterium]
PAPAGPALDGYEQQVLATLMDARRAAGVPAPQLDATLVGLARQRSADMATRNYFSHYSPDGSTIFTLLNASGTPWSYAGETIARNNYPSAQSAGVAAQALLNSPPHRAVILDPQYNFVGIGDAVDANGMHYYTVVFVRR